MAKGYSDSIKLKHLKQYTTGNALEVIKNYHLGQELDTAFKLLDDHYGRAEMVIRESLRNLRKLEAVTSQHNVTANKRLISNIRTNISTLKCYNFDMEENEIENSGLMIDIETKIPYELYIDWEEEKTKLKREGRCITLEKFMDFYTEKVTREENAQYLRQNTRTEAKSSYQKSNKALLLHTSGYTNRNHVPRTVIQHNKIRGVSGDKTRGTGQRGKDRLPKPNEKTPTRTPGEGTPRFRYCIFCEMGGHDTRYCKINKYTQSFKENKCNKHNACYMCFKTTEHHAQTCPYRVPCYICKKIHHFNNHSRKEINAYYEKTGNSNKNRNHTK